MDPLTLTTPLPLIALYAETHFRFSRYIPSFLYKKYPEVLFDTPRRLDPGKPLPVVLIINDIKRFPVNVSDIALTINKIGTTPQLRAIENPEQYLLKHPLSHNQHAYLFQVPRDKLPQGEFFVNAKVTITGKHFTETVFNDNFITTSKMPFTCHASEEELPGRNFCVYSDLHVHSVYSQSHVEFGPPVEVIRKMAETSGLQCIAITDHSYDLECTIDDYLIKDQSVTRYQLFQEELESCRDDNQLFTIPGEEVSCLNSRGKVVHLCCLGSRRFIPGSLDGARHYSKKDKQLSIREAVKAIHEQEAFAFAAHPGARAKFMQHIFLHRGEWENPDLLTGIDAMQAANGSFTDMWERGKQLWIKMLQRGLRVPVLGGNDAHGDFNRYRAIQLPFFKIHENSRQFMGCIKTGIYGHPDSITQCIGFIREGKTFVTNGPFIALSTSLSPDNCCIGSATLQGKSLFILAISSKEFGFVRKVTLLGTPIGTNRETQVFTKGYDDKPEAASVEILRHNLEKLLYVRAEVVTMKEDKSLFFAATSACFLT